jgi:hypothetical protein
LLRVCPLVLAPTPLPPSATRVPILVLSPAPALVLLRVRSLLSARAPLPLQDLLVLLRVPDLVPLPAQAVAGQPPVPLQHRLRVLDLVPLPALAVLLRVLDLVPLPAQAVAGQPPVPLQHRLRVLDLVPIHGAMMNNRRATKRVDGPGLTMSRATGARSPGIEAKIDTAASLNIGRLAYHHLAGPDSAPRATRVPILVLAPAPGPSVAPRVSPRAGPDCAPSATRVPILVLSPAPALVMLRVRSLLSARAPLRLQDLLLLRVLDLVPLPARSAPSDALSTGSERRFQCHSQRWP